MSKKERWADGPDVWVDDLTHYMEAVARLRKENAALRKENALLRDGEARPHGFIVQRGRYGQWSTVTGSMVLTRAEADGEADNWRRDGYEVRVRPVYLGV